MVPVSIKEEISTGMVPNWVNYPGEAMSGGFVLDWRTQFACSECESSIGRCWFNSVKLWCICSDGKVSYHRCNNGATSQFIFLF